MKKIIGFIFIFSLLSACNMPARTPEYTVPKEFIQIISPQDGDILTVPFEFNVRVWRFGANVSSIEIKQSNDGNTYTYGPVSANPSLMDQTITVPNLPITPDGSLLGIINYAVIANLTDGSRIESETITVCVTSLDRTISSYFYDFGTYSGNATICIPTILPDSSATGQIAIDGVIQFAGNRCQPFHNNQNTESYAGGILVSMFAQTHATDAISKVTADVNFRDDAFALSYFGGEEEFFLQGSNIWLGYHGVSYPSTNISIDPNYYPLPNNFNRLEVTFKAYNSANELAATDIANLDIPPCAQGGGEPIRETPTLIPTVDIKPSDPTKTPKPDKEQTESPTKTSCPPTILCAP